MAARQEPFFRTKAGRLTLVGVLSLDAFVVPPLLALRAVPERTSEVFFAVTMLVGIWAMGSGGWRKVVLAIALPAFAIQLTRFASASPAFAVADAALSALALGAFAAMVLADVLRTDPSSDRLLDVILAYLLVGGCFAAVYELVEIAIPGSIRLAGRPAGVSDFAYFSFSTLTTVGFGDALATHPVSRSIAMLEALTGQLYVAVLIARFVGGSVPRR